MVTGPFWTSGKGYPLGSRDTAARTGVPHPQPVQGVSPPRTQEEVLLCRGR